MGIVAVVPQQSIYIVEYLGKYKRQLGPGLNFLIPVLERVRYRLSIKENTYELQKCYAVTRDNVIIHLDGILYFKVSDPVKASYGAKLPIDYTQLLAQSIMRSEVGKLTLDQTFEERETVNFKILEAIQEATKEWGVQCTRYEIKDVILSESMKVTMNQEAEAERIKRAEILKSEGTRTSELNKAEAEKRSLELAAEGRAQATLLEAQALAIKLALFKDWFLLDGGRSFNFKTAEAYLRALRALRGKHLILRKPIENPESMLAEAKSLLMGKVK